MPRFLLPNCLHPLLFAGFVVTACHGQAPADQPPAGSPAAPATAGSPLPKLVGTQGSTRQQPVNTGLQDQAGNLWFGTTGEGVYRYDGQGFTQFTDKDGLSSNDVLCVYQDRAGRLWVGTTTGLCRLDGQRFSRIPLPSVDGNGFYPVAGTAAAGAQPEVRSLLQDRAGQFWLGTSVGVYRYDGTRFTRFGDEGSAPPTYPLRFAPVPHLLEDRAGNIWYTTWFKGIYRFDGHALTNFQPNNEVWFDALYEDKAGHIWVGRRDKGVCRYDGRAFTNVLAKGTFDACGVSAITQDAAGNLWFGTEAGSLTLRETTGGAWRYNPMSGVFTNFTTASGLPHNSVFSIVKERSGKLWFGTRNLGLCRYDGQRFTRFSGAGAGSNVRQ